jgi:hypothetical protein
MDRQAITAAYEPFVAALRTGSFAALADGWNADLIAAHVAKNNDLIADVAERIIAGTPASYDNLEAVEDETLQAFINTAEGLGDLADAVETSVRRLADAWTALGDTTGSQLVPVVIRDSGTVVREGPMPTRELIEGNASFHLEMHVAQLNELRT